MIAKIHNRATPVYIKSPDYLKFVLLFDCCCKSVDCFGDVIAAHTKNPGKGLKDDGGAVPMCWRHHGAHHYGCDSFEIAHPGRIQHAQRTIWDKWINHRCGEEHFAEVEYFKAELSKLKQGE